MNTKVWGKAGWVFLHSTTFNYPSKINENNPEHVLKKKYTKQLFKNLRHTLPCKYCRISFTNFLKELPIDNYLGSRKELTFWLYSIHDKVNKKLLKQEKEAFEERQIMLLNDLNHGKITEKQMKQELKKAKKEIFYTKPSPSYEEVCEKYEGYRAKCAKVKGQIASCRLPKHLKIKK